MPQASRQGAAPPAAAAEPAAPESAAEPAATEPAATTEPDVSNLSEKKIKGKIYYVDNSTTPKKVYTKNADDSCGDYVGYIDKSNNRSKIVWNCTLDS